MSESSVLNCLSSESPVETRYRLASSPACDREYAWHESNMDMAGLTQTFGQTCPVGPLDRLAKTFDGRKDLLGQVVLIV